MNIYPAQNSVDPNELVLSDDDVLTQLGLTSRVILFNDEDHTFDEVIRQIVKAIRCTIEHAEALTLEVHFRGRAQVFEGEIGACLRVSSILEEIALHTQVLT